MSNVRVQSQSASSEYDLVARPIPATPTSSSPQLPDPKDFPSRFVVLYDGRCRFCKTQVTRLWRCDFSGRLAFLSLHDPRVGELYPDLTHEQLMQQMYVVTPDGRRLGGIHAFRRLSRIMPLLWPIAPALHLPGTFPIWNWCYQQVARRRYMFGKVEACEDGACEIHFRKSKG